MLPAVTGNPPALHRSSEKEHDIDISMSREANPWDNATCESFMKTLKDEEVLRNEYRDLVDGLTSIPDFRTRVFNVRRLRSALGCVPLAEFEVGLAAGTKGAAVLAFHMSFRNHSET